MPKKKLKASRKDKKEPQMNRHLWLFLVLGVSSRELAIILRV